MLWRGHVAWSVATALNPMRGASIIAAVLAPVAVVGVQAHPLRTGVPDVPPASRSSSLAACLAESTSNEGGRVEYVTRQSLNKDPGAWFAAAQSDNVAFHFSPEAIAYPKSSEQVAQCVRCAAEHSVPVVARSGGHSFAGYSSGGQDGALVVDLRALNAKQYHPSTLEGPTAEFGPSARLGDVVRFLWTSGRRGMSHGTCPTVAIGGHTMCNGFGPTSAAWGLMADNLIDADMVLANGSSVRVSQDHNSDLLWALRGAGQFYGIATRFRFRTHDASSPMGFIQYRWNALSQSNGISGLIQSLQAWTSAPDFPNELGFHLQITPTQGSVRAEIRGMWLKPVASFSPFAQKLRSLMDQYRVPQPSLVNVKEVNYLQLAALWDDFGDARHKLDPAALNGTHDNFVAKSILATDRSKPLTKDASKNLAAYIHALPSSAASDDWSWNLYMEMYGLPQAVYRRPAMAQGASAPARDGTWLIQAAVVGPTEKPLPAQAHTLVGQMESQVRHTLTESGSTPAGFACYVDADKALNQDWKSQYYGFDPGSPDGGPTWSRLVRLKHQVDPHNVFRSPQSLGTAPGIKPPEDDLDYSVHPLP